MRLTGTPSWLNEVAAYIYNWLSNVSNAVEGLQSNQAQVTERMQRADQLSEAEQYQQNFFNTFDSLSKEHELFNGLSDQGTKEGFLRHLSDRGYTVEQLNNLDVVRMAYLDYNKKLVEMLLNGANVLTTENANQGEQQVEPTLVPSGGGLQPNQSGGRTKPTQFAPQEELYQEEPVVGA